MHATRGSASSSASASAPFSNNAKLCKSNQCVTKIDPCSLPEVSFCRPVYLQPRYGVLATKESLLRLWCDLGARRLLYGAAQLGRARRPVHHSGVASPATLPRQWLWLRLLRQRGRALRFPKLHLRPRLRVVRPARALMRSHCNIAFYAGSPCSSWLKRRYLRRRAMQAIFFRDSSSAHPSTGQTPQPDAVYQIKVLRV